MVIRNQLANSTAEKVSESENSKSNQFYLPNKAVAWGNADSTKSKNSLWCSSQFWI